MEVSVTLMNSDPQTYCMQSRYVRETPPVLDFMTSIAVILFIIALMGQKFNLPAAALLCILRGQKVKVDYPSNFDFYTIHKYNFIEH